MYHMWMRLRRTNQQRCHAHLPAVLRNHKRRILQVRIIEVLPQHVCQYSSVIGRILLRMDAGSGIITSDAW